MSDFSTSHAHSRGISSVVFFMAEKVGYTTLESTRFACVGSWVRYPHSPFFFLFLTEKQRADEFGQCVLQDQSTESLQTCLLTEA